MLSTGCAQRNFIKDGGTPQSFQGDLWDCKQKVVVMYGGQSQMGFGHLATMQGDIADCLQSRGWRETAAPAAPALGPNPYDKWPAASGPQSQLGPGKTQCEPGGPCMSEADSLRIYEKERERILKENAEVERNVGIAQR